jgi:hypothetical protein
LHCSSSDLVESPSTLLNDPPPLDDLRFRAGASTTLSRLRQHYPQELSDHWRNPEAERLRNRVVRQGPQPTRIPVEPQVGPFDQWPSGMGFEYFYGFVVGDTSQWQPNLFRNTTAIYPYVGKPG